jgi:adenylate kinase
MLRAAVRDGTEFGLKAKAYMDEGKLLPDDIMVGLVAERLAQADARPGWLLDGYPRTSGQADALDAVTGDAPFSLAINLDVPEDVVLERISSRRVCVDCGTNYSVQHPPTHPWDCDKCGGKVVQREDDTEAAVNERLALYREQTAPLIEWFDARGKLATVNGNAALDVVTEALIATVDERLS